MSEPPKRGRVHDAEGAREAILNAAEKVFAEHGFDGARVDLIAKTAGYNKSLIFQYFGDKLGVYDAVIRRADKNTSEMQAYFFSSLLDDDAPLDADKFKSLLKKLLRNYFDYLVQNPSYMHILMWEMAEGWQTTMKILSQRDLEDVERFKLLIEKARDAGLLQPGFSSVALLVMVEFIFPCFLSLAPLIQHIQSNEDVTSAAAIARARDYMIDFVIRGLLIDSPGGNP
jgi:AcrR family transcriptional regulator